MSNLSVHIENFKNDYDTTVYRDSNNNVIQFNDSNGTSIMPLINNPSNYPFKPVELNDPPSFPKENITQANLNDLRMTYNHYIRAAQLKTNNEVNEIKYRVLYANNLGQKNYEHLYFVEHDTDSELPDFFPEILDKLIVIFPDATFEYILKDGIIQTVDKINKTYYSSYVPSTNIILKENGKYAISNIIKISWS
jgi:hypothetical protein